MELVWDDIDWYKHIIFFNRDKYWESEVIYLIQMSGSVLCFQKDNKWRQGNMLRVRKY